MPQDNESPGLSQSETAYDRLYAAIQDGTFRPGDRLRETDISDRIGLSRTPVRDALRRLETEGIVEHRPRLGAVIRTLGHAEVVELYEMRVVLERTAAEMAATHASLAEIEALEDINTLLGASIGGTAEAARINASFHDCLFEAARNQFLIRSARTLNNAVALLGPTTIEDARRVEEACREHTTITDALRARNASDAGSAAVQHIETSLRYRLRAIRR